MNPLALPRSLRATVVAALAASALVARAADPAAGGPAIRTSLTADLYGHLAPEGVQLNVGAVRRWSVPDVDSALLRGRYAELGVSAGSNPAYAQGAVWGEWVPVAPLQLRVQYDLYGFYGANGSLLRFPSASSPFGDAEIDALAGTERTGIGHRLMAVPVLRARLGPVVLRNQTELAWYRMSSEPGWYYEWEYDTLLASSDLVVNDRLAAMVELWRGAGAATLLAGPAWELTHSAKADITRQRAEGVLFWSPADRLGPFARPRVIAVVGLNVQDRNREGDLFAILGAGADLDR